MNANEKCNFVYLYLKLNLIFKSILNLVPCLSDFFERKDKQHCDANISGKNVTEVVYLNILQNKIHAHNA